MKIAITGANGYIGRRVVQHFLSEGKEVLALLRKNAEPHPLLLDGADIVQEDIFSLTKSHYKSLFNGCDTLLHLAWNSGFNHRDPSHLQNVQKHFEFLTNIYEFTDIKQISVAGTMHEIGYHVGAVDADTPCNPRNPYGIAKNFLRQAMFDFATTADGLCLQWLRFYYITGDDKFNNSIFTKILQAESEEKKEFPLNSGEMLYDFIEINELARQIAAKIGSGDSGIFNCSSGKPKSLRRAVEDFILEHNLSIRPKYNVFPERAYDSVAIWGKGDK